MSMFVFVCMHMDQPSAKDTSLNGITGVAAKPMLRSVKGKKRSENECKVIKMLTLVINMIYVMH